MKGHFRIATLFAILTTFEAARADVSHSNCEAPRMQTLTPTFSVMGVETFDEQPVGVNSGFSTDFGTGGTITGIHGGTNGIPINSANVFGGAGKSGRYAVACASNPYTVTLSSDPKLDPEGINHFGYWMSALDAGNIVTFHTDGVQVGQVTPGEVSAIASLDRNYDGNPSAVLAGHDPGEPFAFINFYDTTGTFNQITFTENPNVGGYELENQTVGFYTETGGVAAPESSTYLMIVTGVVGFAALTARRPRPSRYAIDVDFEPYLSRPPEKPRWSLASPEAATLIRQASVARLTGPAKRPNRKCTASSRCPDLSNPIERSVA